MRSSTSSSEARFVAALALTFLALVGIWESVLRRRASAGLDLSSPAMTARAKGAEEWVVFGNCLMMTGVSPTRLKEQLPEGRERTVVNIGWHEQSPIAFFEYLRESGHYPAVVITNVSSWLNGTNFEQEGELVTKADPLHLRSPAAASTAGVASGAREQAFRQDGAAGEGRLQRQAEETLTAFAGTHLASVGHRYHLFDFSLFLGVLATTANVDNALYQLNMQSWFRVEGSETDGRGFLGLHVTYRDDWSEGLDRMAERSLQRMRLSRLLTPRYWTLLEEGIRDAQSHGTQVVLVRMPEHPKIRKFNDDTYELPNLLREIEARTGAPVVDLSRLGPADGVRLFDAVHPDAPSAEVITREIARAMRARAFPSVGAARLERAGGG